MFQTLEFQTSLGGSEEIWNSSENMQFFFLKASLIKRMKSPSSDNILNKRGFVIFLLFNLFIISHHSPEIPNEFCYQTHMSSRLE